MFLLRSGVTHVTNNHYYNHYLFGLPISPAFVEEDDVGADGRRGRGEPDGGEDKGRQEETTWVATTTTNTRHRVVVVFSRYTTRDGTEEPVDEDTATLTQTHARWRGVGVGPPWQGMGAQAPPLLQVDGRGGDS